MDNEKRSISKEFAAPGIAASVSLGIGAAASVSFGIGVAFIALKISGVAPVASWPWAWGRAAVLDRCCNPDFARSPGVRR